MRSTFPRVLPAACLGLGGLFLSLTVSPAFAQKNKKASPTEAGGDKSLEKQSAWEQKVMGQDGDKEADRKKIAAAQKMAAEAKKNPPPEPAVHHKDPSKEGVNAKRESSIGLPIESEQAEKASAKKTPVAKKAAPTNQGNDELGALVAASLASDKKAEAEEKSSSASDSSGKSRGKKGKKAKAAASTSAKTDAQPSSLDRMFAGGK